MLPGELFAQEIGGTFGFLFIEAGPAAGMLVLSRVYGAIGPDNNNVTCPYTTQNYHFATHHLLAGNHYKNRYAIITQVAGLLA